jgi:hypothetical protein
MEINKVHWQTDGDHVRLSMPIAKVDKENRIVSGFATLDNIDQHGDVVDAEASTRAFERFRGNIREMHQPIAVGKMVSFRKEKLFNKENGKEYTGVFVDAYVSKGAQDTWEKVLDGTLTGFSIGGNVKKADSKYDPEMEKSVRVIKEYDLTELSLVDNPANQLSNIVSIQKTADGNTIIKGIAADIVVENIFYDKTTDQVYLSVESEFKSPDTNELLDSIGWVESADANKSVEINRILDTYKSSSVLPDSAIAKQVEVENTEGGVTVADDITTPEEVNENTAAVDETPVAEEVSEVEEVVEEAAEETAAEEVEKSIDGSGVAADISEVEVEETDFAKMLDDLKTFFSAELTKTATADAVSSLTSQVEAKIAEVTEKYNELASAVEEIKTTMSSVQKRVDSVEDDTAIKKSSDLEGSETPKIKKSMWGGHFLSVRNL